MLRDGDARLSLYESVSDVKLPFVGLNLKII